jgi:hypothetical protein
MLRWDRPDRIDAAYSQLWPFECQTCAGQFAFLCVNNPKRKLDNKALNDKQQALVAPAVPL